MSSPAITTMITMMETLPEATQNQLLEHMRDYLADLQDEAKWEQQFKQTQPSLIAAARRAKQEIREGLAKPLDPNQL